MKPTMLTAVMLGSLLAAGAQQPPGPAAAPATAPLDLKKHGPGNYCIMETSMGRIVFYLFEKEAPKTVENFVGLATGKKQWKHPGTGKTMQNAHYYDGVVFHRIIPNFMIQTGDPTGTGTGSPGYTIPDEFHPEARFDRPGRVGMANAGPNTGGSQFFITHRATPHLDAKHTIFGQVVEGQEVVVAIADAPRDPRDRPLTPLKIVSVKFERVGEPAPAPEKPKK